MTTPMTDEQIDGLSGAALDEAVAVHVMGWKAETVRGGTMGWWTQPGWLKRTPKFSSDIAAAWRVVDLFAGPAKGERCVIVAITESGEWYCEIGASDDDEHDSFRGRGITPMLAIARAALRASRSLPVSGEGGR
jgi:hypothetical protein